MDERAKKQMAEWIKMHQDEAFMVLQMMKNASAYCVCEAFATLLKANTELEPSSPYFDQITSLHEDISKAFKEKTKDHPENRFTMHKSITEIYWEAFPKNNPTDRSIAELFEYEGILLEIFKSFANDLRIPSSIP